MTDGASQEGESLESAGESAELTEDEKAKLEELDQKIQKFEQQKRWSDVIKSMLAKADIVKDPSEKVSLLSQAGTMYIERSSNQAEAIKCFERVLEHDSTNTEAITRLKEMYEKRRDWERLIRTMQREADLLDPEDQQLRYQEMAQLATERLRKPDICIELWQKVLEFDAENADALQALSSLYERARQWEPLAEVLEKLTQGTTDTQQLKQQLQKLGMIYADKIGNDRGAVEAFKRLLEIEPQDRRAQEQLKRRYTALRAWDELEEFYGQSEKWDELIRILEREAEGENTEEREKIDLLFRAARLWEEKKEKPDRAARAYEKVLEADPDNLDAAEALTPIYEKSKDSRKLVGVYEVRLNHITDPDQRVALLREAGLLYEEKLREPQKAFEKVLEAFTLRPLQEVVREDVERLAEAVDGWDRVISAFSEAIDKAETEDDALEMRMSLGRVLGKVGRTEDAIEQIRTVYDARNDHADAIAALGDLYRQTNRYADLLEIYERRMDLETDPQQRRTIAYQRASLLENELEDPDRAIDAYRSILEEWGDAEVDAYRALDRLYEGQQRWQDLADVLERQIELGDSEEAVAAYKYRLASVLEQRLEQKERAVELYREALTAVPEHEGARNALESLLEDDDVGVQAARILEPTYEVGEEWEKLIRALQVLRDGADTTAQRLELIGKIGEVYGQRIGDPAKAFEAYAHGLRQAPDSEDMLGRLEALAVEQERFGDLVELVRELASSVDDPVLARSLWIKAAKISDEQLDNVDGAVSAYRQVLELDAGDHEALAALDALFRRTERWRDLVGVLRKKAELTSDAADKEELLAQAAQIHDELLEEPDEAIRLYKEILELEPTSQRALSALDSLFERQERWSDLADNVGRRLELAPDPDTELELMLRLADLRERRMNAVEAAVDIYREVLARDPSNATALQALERLMEQPDYQLRVAELLEPVYRDAGEYRKLIHVHEIQAKHASSPEQRVELLHQVAELYETALDEPQQAFDSLVRALAEDPSSSSTQDQLDRLARTTGGTEALARAYEQRVQEVDDPPMAAALHVKAATIREQELGDLEGAIAHYQSVLELDAQHLEAASALERLYQLAERYEDLANVYMTKAEITSTPDEQKDYLFRAASIYEELLERPKDAIGVYDRVLKLDSEDVQALDKLIELYLRLEDWSNLLGVYERKADVVVDPEEKKRLYTEVGAVYERELGDTAKAIDTYQRILEIDPDELTALSRLDALYRATENWEELLSVLEREADLASDPNEVISYRYRIAELWHHKLEDPARAIDIYREILETSPDHEPTLNALESLIAEGKEPVAAAGVLEPVYKQTGEWAKLINVYEVQVAHEQDPVRQVELLHQIAELYETHLDQPRQAFDAFARALPLDDRNEHTLASLERLADLCDAWGELARFYDQDIERLKESAPDDVVDMALRTAQVYEVQLGNVDTAIDRYRLVIDADEAHAQALEALDRLYEATERWRELADVLHKEIAIASTPEDILKLQFRLGQLSQQQLGDVDQAIEQYREILAAAPEHTQAMAALEQLFAEEVRPTTVGEILEPLYRMQEAWHKLLGVQEVQVAFEQDAAERVAMMHRIAELAEERAQDPGRAFVWMQRALLEDPTHDHTGAEVERLAQILDGWPQLADTYATALESNDDPEAAAALGRRLARVYEEELGDVERAEATYRFVLRIAPSDEDVLRNLDRIYLQNGAHEALAHVLRRRIQATDNPEDQVELEYRLGQVLETELGRADEAVEMYRHVLDELDPRHAESIQALETIYKRRQDWSNLYQTLERELEVVVGDQQQSEIVAKMARLASEGLGDYQRAIEMWERVLDLRGEDAEALNALGNIYAAQENWRDLVDILEREVAIADDDQVRVQIHADLGRIWYEKLGRERNALDAWEHALDVDPTNTDALFHIAEIHRAGKQWHEFVDTLHRIIDLGAATLEDESLENVYMQLGYFYAFELEQPMDAVEAYRNALQVNPASFGAMDALEYILRQEERWDEVVAVMEQRAEAFQDPEAKINELLAVCRTWEEEAGEPDRATNAYQRILEAEPLHRYAFRQLEDLHRTAGRWDDLVEMYVARVESTEDLEETIDLLRKVAQVYEKELGEKEQAFEALKLAWQQDFSRKETRDELERITGLTDKWNELLTEANQALQEAQDNDTRIHICLACARWYGQKLNHPEYAIPYYQQILALDKANVPAMRQMAELYRQTQQWQTLTQILARLVEMTEDPKVKADTHVEMGELCENQLGVPEQARGYYETALQLDPDNVGALEALERIHQYQGDWQSLLQVRERKAAALTDPQAILEAKLQVAEVLEYRLQDPERAVAAYREVLELDEHNLRTLKGLERLYAQTEQWQPLVDILERQYEVVSTERERINILTRLASMWEEEFVKPDKAAERFEQVLEIDPVHEEALSGLERLYRRMQRWDDLIHTYERHVEAAPERKEKIRLYKAIGEVYHTEKRDLDRAVDAYLNVLGLDEEDVEALDALTRLYEKRGEQTSALEMMEQLSKLVEDPERKVDLQYRLGRILDEQMGDRTAALDHYQAALDVNPGHLESLEAMRKIHADSGDWLAAARTLEQEIEHQEGARAKAKLYVELGRVYQEQLDEHERGIEAFESALAQDPENEDAAMPLVDEYIGQERYEAAHPLLQNLFKRMNKREAEQQQQLAYRLGLAASRLGHDEEAIKALNKAYELDSQHLDSLLELSAAYYRTQDWDKAFKFYQMLLVHHRDSLSREHITEIFYRLGVVKREQGERRKALNMFDKALEEDTHHRPTLEAVVELYQSQKDWQQVIQFKKQILEVAEEEDERIKLLEEIGDLWREQVNNLQKAIEAYQEAVDLRPEDHRLLHKLLQAYQETRQWEKAIETIEHIAALDDRASAKAKYLYTIGVIRRDELKDPEGAVEKFNESLDTDSSQLKAFEAINKIYTQKKDWKNLERAFRKMLHRVLGQGETDLEFNLWHNLGIIYRDRQKNFEAAAEAFHMATQLKPEEATEHQILAELYAVMPEHLEDSISEHQWLLRRDPYRIDSYKALYKLYFDARAYDKAWCLAAALHFLEKADQEQDQFYKQYRQQGMIRPKSRLDQERWIKDLFHPDEDRYVSKIMEIVASAVHAAKATTDKALHLNKKHEVDLQNSTVTFARTYGFIAQVMNLTTTPRLFLRPDAQGGLAHVPGSNPPATICGSSLLSGYSPQDLAFIIGRHLTYYRLEHFIRTMLQGHSEMKTVLLAAMQIAGVAPSDAKVGETAQQLQRNMTAAQVDALRTACKKFVDAGGRSDIKQWMQAVELTACRAGLLTCNDLGTAARMIQQLPAEGPTDLAPKEKIKEMVLFSVSEEYFRLRETLGIQIQV